MASLLSSFLSRFAPPPPAAPVAKAAPLPLAVGVVPGLSTTLRQDALGQPHDANFDLLYALYRLNPDVSGAVDRWVGAVTGNGWRITPIAPETSPDAAVSQQMADLTLWLANPNPQKRFDLLAQELVTHLGICGNAYWQVIKDAKGTPQELWSIHPASMRVLADEHGAVAGYVQRVNHLAAVTFTPDEIVHFRLPNAHNDLYGESPLVRALEEVKHDLKAVRANERLFDQGYALSAILMMDKDLDAKQVEEFVRNFRRQHQGVENNHKLGVIQGATDLKPYSTTPREMEFATLRALSTEKIATAYGVPKLFLNQKDAADYATSDVMERQLYYGKGKPLQALTAAPLTEAVIHAFNPALKFEWLMPEFGSPDQIRADALVAFQAGALSAAEVRQYFFALPATTDEGPTDAAEPEPGEQVTDPVEVDTGETANQEGATKRLTKATTPTNDDLAAQRDAEQDQLMAPLIPALTGYFTNQQQRYLDALNGRDALAEDDLAPYLTQPKDTDDAALVAILAALLVPVLAAGRAAAEAQSGQSVAEPRTQAPLADYIQHQAFAHVQGINETTRTQLRATLLDGIENGDSIPQLAERIQAVFASASDTRATLIARTETAQAYSFANHAVLAALAEDGLIGHRQWLCAPEGGCPICEPLDGYTIRFDAQYPDGLEPGAAHPSCKCTEVGLP